jgi:hypothetical protein
MFLADTEHLIFRPTAHNGFDVRDFSTLGIALQKLNEEIKKQSATNGILTIEFARDDYHQALQKFDSGVLRDAYFLYIYASVETCLQRVHERVIHASSIDDHPSISDELFKIYYREDHRSYMRSKFSRDFDVSDRQVGIIENEGSYKCFLNETCQTLDTFLELIPSLPQAQGILTGSAS